MLKLLFRTLFLFVKSFSLCPWNEFNLYFRMLARKISNIDFFSETCHCKMMSSLFLECVEKMGGHRLCLVRTCLEEDLKSEKTGLRSANKATVSVSPKILQLVKCSLPIKDQVRI